jgi:hypothetical protein
MQVIKAINNDIMPIQISSEKMTEISYEKYNAIDINTSVKAHELVPFFEMYIRSKEYELGLKRNLWSGEQLKKIEDEFAIKYLT